MKPDRKTGLKRLEAFLPHAGADYGKRRNEVPGVVSGLSPYLRHRLLTEDEVVGEVLKRHSFGEAEKFIQEICWRTYWKGWLEMRPWVWSQYLDELQSIRSTMEGESDLKTRLLSAERGETGLECLDDWVTELRATGYLHNHVRMWFASIWVHTLRLPWQLGADFFMRHLLDGDPASNTLSWRWVCGLQTKGKVYLASAENIQRFTHGRYAPHGLLANEAPPVTELSLLTPALQPAITPACADIPIVGERTLLLVTEEDLTPESWGIPESNLAGIALVDANDSDIGLTALPKSFKRIALENTEIRLEAGFQCPVVTFHLGDISLPEKAHALFNECRASSISVMSNPVGPLHSLIEPQLVNLERRGVFLRRLRRPWDYAFWPYATHGFFKLKEEIPSILRHLSLSS